MLIQFSLFFSESQGRTGTYSDESLTKGQVIKNYRFCIVMTLIRLILLIAICSTVAESFHRMKTKRFNSLSLRMTSSLISSTIVNSNNNNGGNDNQDSISAKSVTKEIMVSFGVYFICLFILILLYYS